MFQKDEYFNDVGKLEAWVCMCLYLVISVDVLFTYCGFSL